MDQSSEFGPTLKVKDTSVSLPCGTAESSTRPPRCITTERVRSKFTMRKKEASTEVQYGVHLQHWEFGQH